jgi:STE24 endopeptidase
LACTTAAFPIACYSFRVQRKFGLLTGSSAAWFRDYLKANVMSFLFGAALMEITFVSQNVNPESGWIYATVCFTLLFAIIAQGFPWILSLFYPVVPLSNIGLRQCLTRLASKARLQIGAIYEWRISARTRQVNAMATGIGSARRVLLTDTLLSLLSEEEVEAIVAHELGHCALHHVAKRILLNGLIFGLLFAGMNFAVHNGLVLFAGLNDSLGWANLALIPGFFFYWTCGRAYGNILVAAFSRRNEKAADLFAWKLIGRVEPFVTALRKLSDTNLIVFDKKSEWRFGHPAMAERLAAAERFAKANGEVLPSFQPPTPVDISLSQPELSSGPGWKAGPL